MNYIAQRGGRFVSVLPATRKEDRTFRQRLREGRPAVRWQPLVDYLIYVVIRVLIAKAGLDGHDRGAKVIAQTLQPDLAIVVADPLRVGNELGAEALQRHVGNRPSHVGGEELQEL